MIKKLLFLALVFQVFVSNSQNRPTKLWDATFGGSDSESFTKIIQASDSSFLICGNSYSGISGDKTVDRMGTNGFTDFWIVKTNALGQKIWDKSFGGAYTDYARTIIETQDGGFLIGGNSESTIGGDKSQAGQGGHDYWVIKITKDGVKEWDATFGGSRDDDLTSIVETNDGGYLLGGYSDSRITGDKTEENRDLNALRADYWVVKITGTGTKVWDKTYGNNRGDFLRAIVKIETGGYLLTGESYSDAGNEKTGDLRGNYNLGDCDFWVIKIDESGSILWDKVYGGNSNDILRAAIQTNDNGFLLGGGSRSGISSEKSQACRGQDDSWLVKIDSTGNVEWDATFGYDGQEYVEQIVQSFDGNFIFATASGSGIGGEKTQDKMGWFDYWLVKVDQNGAKIWDGTYGGDDGDYCFGLVESFDKGLVLAGQSSSNISGQKSQNSRGGLDYWMINLLNSGLDFTLPSSTLCLRSEVEIGYNVRGIFNSGNLCIAQLSDENGSFASPTNVDSVLIEGTGAYSGHLTLTIPPSAPVGTNYQLRVISTNPQDTSESIQFEIEDCCASFGSPTASNGTGELYGSNNCAGENMYLLSTSVPDATGYRWTGPNGFTSDQQNPVIDSITAENSGTYTVVAINDECTSTSSSVTVDVRPRSATPTISNDGPYTSGQTIHLFCAETASNYEWTGTYPFSSAIQNPTIANATVANAGIYNVRINTNGCWSLFASTTVIVDGSASIEEINVNRTAVYPNPMLKEGVLTIQINDPALLNKTADVILYNKLGQIEMQNKMVLDSFNTIQFPALKNGIYTLQFVSKEKTFVHSIVVE